MKKNNARRVAFGGVVSALSLTAMFLTGIIPSLEYTLPAISGILLIVLVLEFNKRTAYLSFAAIAILSFLITPNKEAALLFTCFFGYYPILKSTLEKPKNRIVEWSLKFLIFNACIGIGYLLLVYVLGATELLQSLEGITKYGTPILLLLANGAFVIYDMALSSIVKLYFDRIVKKIKLH